MGGGFRIRSPLDPTLDPTCPGYELELWKVLYDKKDMPDLKDHRPERRTDTASLIVNVASLSGGTAEARKFRISCDRQTSRPSHVVIHAK
jgi:hypothetical protein